MKAFKILVISMMVAFPMNSFAKGGGGKHIKKVLEQLNLTADQQTKIKSIHEGDKQAHKQSKDQMRKNKEEFKRAMSDATVSELKLKELHESMISAKVAKMRSKFEKSLKVRAILSPEQQVKFRELMKEHKGKKRGGRGKHSDDDSDY